MTDVRIRPAGDRALLVELPGGVAPAGFSEYVRAHPIEGIADLLPAARTVLVTLEPGATKVEERLSAVVAEVAAAAETPSDGGPLVVPVRYDGADLAETAALLGIGEQELIARHTGHIWRCAFLGFAPGFGYLEAPDAGLSVPRRDRSRTAVPAGAVALAGGYSAVYPRRSPGGWRIIGSTDVVLWDLGRSEPALLRPGARVRFVDEGNRRG
ncbi:allophanate hydrolase subunit 1 [Nocardia sp. CDC159]|uniref:Allophanate hydrolase subunit 1 n=1 Tax=Nocardia pulmonis TaxID=2951408 RepID=A0A9X2E766_9NOCA|nr:MULTISPECIES: allophanate hydrolase subunit 1 [Nocardia]MCM6775499.1 allophanate hydrolase subunit 1 [Nocardia pulmonis]MCM6787767.1 allophanate hydrolase subunit 1 [Nocardia sp. CDC159]